MAHELGHLKCDHGVWLTFANILTLGAYTVPGRWCFTLLCPSDEIVVTKLSSVVCSFWANDSSNLGRTDASLATFSRADL